jgi:hypothetical protein|tara:strand:- start:1411 stop:1794 length:384 start_codon:yes stop_codon:yes gene_type:complete
MKREYIHKNISGTTAVAITRRYDDNNDYDIFSMILCNTHATDSVYVDLYLNKPNVNLHFPGKDGNWDEVADTSTTIYIIKDIEITANNTLVLEKEEIEFDSTAFDFFIQLNAADSEVDLILNKQLNK